MAASCCSSSSANCRSAWACCTNTSVSDPSFFCQGDNMKKPSLTTLALALAAALGASTAQAAANEVVIGDIDDMSGVYADVIGQGGVEATKMAIADFGGTVL